MEYHSVAIARHLVDGEERSGNFGNVEVNLHLNSFLACPFRYESTQVLEW